MYDVPEEQAIAMAIIAEILRLDLAEKDSQLDDVLFSVYLAGKGFSENEILWLEKASKRENKTLAQYAWGWVSRTQEDEGNSYLDIDIELLQSSKKEKQQGREI